jgi:hypothetical protein
MRVPLAISTLSLSLILINEAMVTYLSCFELNMLS